MTRHSVNSAGHWTITDRATRTGGDKGNSPRTVAVKTHDRQEHRGEDASQISAAGKNSAERLFSNLNTFWEAKKQ